MSFIHQTDYKTQTEDVDILVEALESAREQCAIFAGCASNNGVNS